MVRIALGIAVLLLASFNADAALIYTAPLDRVIPHADVIVRGAPDLAAGTIDVKKVYRGEVKPGKLTVDNMKLLWSRLIGANSAKHPTNDAILCLHEHDGRYDLVNTSSPWWIEPFAAVRFVGKDDIILGLHQQVNPGGVELVPEPRAGCTSIAMLEKTLQKWLALPRILRPRPPALSEKELASFEALVRGAVDTYRRRAADLTPRRLAAVTDRIVGEIEKTTGAPRHRRIGALLILAEQRGPHQSRREHVEKKLFALIEKIGPETFLEPALAELSSLDLGSSKSAAARIVRRIGGDAVKRGRKILLGHIVEPGDISLATKSYWALKDMGFARDAERAFDARRKLDEVRKPR